MTSSRAAGLPAIHTLTYDKVISRRWTEDLPTSADYFFDEPTVILNKRSDDNDFPPDGMDLSDAWVVAIVRSGISGDDRHRRWPIVFTQRILRATYVHKGQASKAPEKGSKHLKYVVIFGQNVMYGSEGAALGLPDKIDGTSHSTSATELGLMAQVQDINYDFDQAEEEATNARAKDKGKKRTTTEPGPTTRQVKRGKLPEENTGDDNEETMVTRSQTKSAPSRIKAIPRKPGRPTKKAVNQEVISAEETAAATTGSVDDWAGPPVTSTKRNRTAHLFTKPVISEDSANANAKIKLLITQRNDSRLSGLKLLTHLRDSQHTVINLLAELRNRDLSDEDMDRLHVTATENDALLDRICDDFPVMGNHAIEDDDNTFKQWINTTKDNILKDKEGLDMQTNLDGPAQDSPKTQAPTTSTPTLATSAKSTLQTLPSIGNMLESSAPAPVVSAPINAPVVAPVATMIAPAISTPASTSAPVGAPVSATFTPINAPVPATILGNDTHGSDEDAWTGLVKPQDGNFSAFE